MLQSWLAKLFQNRNQGSLWPGQREMVRSRRCLISSFLADLPSSYLAFSLLKSVLPLSTRFIFWLVTLDLIAALIQIFQFHPTVDYLAEHTGDLGLKSPSHCCLWAADLGPLHSPFVPWVGARFSFVPLNPRAPLLWYIFTPLHSWPHLSLSQGSHLHWGHMSRPSYHTFPVPSVCSFEPKCSVLHLAAGLKFLIVVILLFMFSFPHEITAPSS